MHHDLGAMSLNRSLEIEPSGFAADRPVIETAQMDAKNFGSLLGALLLGLGPQLAGPPPAKAETSTASERERAASELKLGAESLRARKFGEAQRHYQAALKLDPGQKAAWVLLGRSIRAQYKPGARDARNLAKAKEAIAAYEKALDLDPNQDEAFASVIELS